MSIDATTLIGAVRDHALTTGLFERVNGHEPKNAPGNGLTAAVWVQDIGPVLSSGLAKTSARLALNVRIYSSMLQEPQDAIDPNIVSAVDDLFTAYSSDFELGGNVRCVDLLGMAGAPLSAQAGYLEQDKKLFRVMTITLPLIVDDAWDQVA